MLNDVNVYEWWHDERLAARLETAITHFNEARATSENRPLDACRGYLSGLNILYSALKFLSKLNDRVGIERADASSLTALLCQIPNNRRFAREGVLQALAEFEPKIMDQSAIIGEVNDPWAEAIDLPVDVAHHAAKAHRGFGDSFLRFSSHGTRYRPMIRDLASLISVFRNNLQHGEKLGVRARDLMVAEVMRPVLNETVQLILDYPDTRLATYGKLSDEHLFLEITALTPERFAGEVRGEILLGADGLRRFYSGSRKQSRWETVSIASDAKMCDAFANLREFEGRSYEHNLVMAISGGRSLVCNIFEAR